MLKEYILRNWTLILILAALAIALKVTVFLNRKTVRRTFFMIAETFLLSVAVFVEFALAETGERGVLRAVLIAIRYSATPVILAQVISTLVPQMHWLIFLPAAALAGIDLISIFTGIVFRVDAGGVFHRGPLGYLPFIVAGFYCLCLIYLLFRRGSRRSTEIIPIVFLCFAFVSGLVLPFVFGSDYANIFCATIAVALFVYYVFTILQQTKKDPLTGLLNRQACYADMAGDPEDISALLSIDMNGLKAVNDTVGHAAGDAALVALSQCFERALKRRQSCYRVGGDEFVIVCRRCTEDDVLQLVERIRSGVAGTGFSCSVGYSFAGGAAKSVDELLRESDEMMYAEKARYYVSSGVDLRSRK